jgi:hypothetical protein
MLVAVKTDAAADVRDEKIHESAASNSQAVNFVGMQFASERKQCFTRKPGNGLNEP